MKRFYSVTVLLEVDDEDSWGSSCDETFHGPGLLHAPSQGAHVIAYNPITEYAFNLFKNKIFDEYGGI